MNLQILFALISVDRRTQPPAPKRRHEATSLYFDEDFKKLRKERMEAQNRREEQEGNLRLRIMTAQAEELEERALLHRQMRRYFEKAEAHLDSGQNTIVLPVFPALNAEPSTDCYGSH